MNAVVACHESAPLRLDVSARATLSEAFVRTICSRGRHGERDAGGAAATVVALFAGLAVAAHVMRHCHSQTAIVFDEVFREEWVVAVLGHSTLSHVGHDALDHLRTLRIRFVPEVPRVAVVPSMPMVQTSQTRATVLKVPQSVPEAAQEGQGLRLPIHNNWILGSSMWSTYSRLDVGSEGDTRVASKLPEGATTQHVGAPSVVRIVFAEGLHVHSFRGPLVQPVAAELGPAVALDVRSVILVLDIHAGVVQACSELSDERSIAEPI
mmetsp:Transcript_10007/g.22022  ORF Transcript_10007/g.22022 Transcript_10007/m.22022 type:complete len:266 (+) Transcript_10007:222-1019(+)